MAAYWNLETLELSKKLVPYSQENFRKFLNPLVQDFDNSEEMIETMVREVELTIFNEMKNDEFLESATLVAAQNIQENIDFDKLAARLVVMKIYQSALDVQEGDKDFAEVYKRSFKNYLQKGIDSKLLNPELLTLFDIDDIANSIDYKYDDEYIYIGIDTALKRYMVKNRNGQTPLETPQFMWMRVGMGLSLKEENPTEQAKTFYSKYAPLNLIPGGSTNIGSGTTFSVLSNCYLIDTEDDINSIYDNVKHIALISKATGGIGISVTKLRAAGSPVRSNNTFSTGPIPFVKVMDAAVKSVSRAGKKAGAVAIYIENWHYDFDDFLDLRQNAGDDYRRIRTADTAVYISDEFMKRVINNEEWYMFDPLEAEGLAELYGNEFSKKYSEYVKKAKRGEMKLVKKIPAREQLQKILTSLQSTSHPWLTWKDTINVRALNNNTGTIHCSNLCTEVCLPQDKDNIAVCNLLYINISRHLIEGSTPETKIDWNKLKESVRVGMRHLDNLIDVNAIDHIKEAKKSDVSNRAVGLGIMGFSETLETLGIAYDSPESYELIDRIIEFISYNSIEASCDMAEERGAYDNFEGSMWSKGFVPFDTIEKLKKERLGEDFTEEKDPIKQGLGVLKEKIQNGVKNASSEESKELFEIFNQLTEYISTVNKNNNTQESDDEVKNEAGTGVALTQNIKTRMDWDKLRERVKKGIRNATTMMIAPTASTGLLAGTTPGVDPRFANIFSRATSRGKFLDINTNLVRDLRKLGLWEEVKNKVLESYGDISNIEEIPQSLRDIYKTSFQLSPYAFIEVASRAQKWIDQSISRNMYLETRNIDEMIKIYTEAWRRGLKTTYYLHVKPRHSAEQSTVKVNKARGLNKKGFGDVARTAMSASTEDQDFASIQVTEQLSLDKDETKKVKGFGFAKFTSPVKEESALPEVHVESPMQTLSSGVGFGKVLDNPQALKKEEVKEEPKVKPNFNFQACPIDPMERAACESCQ